MPFFENSYQSGNLNIIFNVDFPRSLDLNQKDTIKSVLKSQIRKPVVDNINGDYLISDFKPEDENTSHRGGKEKIKEEDKEENEGPKIQCQNQ